MFGLQLRFFPTRAQRKGSCSRSWRHCKLILIGAQLARCTSMGAGRTGCRRSRIFAGRRIRDAIHTIELNRMCPRFLHRACSMCAALANHGIVSSHGGRVFVIGRLCEGFACMLELVTRVSVVKDFGVGGRRTDRMGSTALAWDVDCHLDRRPWRVSAACFRLVSNSWTWQDRTENSDTFRPSRRNRDESQGTTSWKNSRRRTSAEQKTCCSRHVGSSLFQFLGVTRHVPFMVLERWARMV